MGNYEKYCFWHSIFGFWLTIGTWRTHAETTPDALLPLPEGARISPVSAATISVNPFTADRMMLDFAQLKEGDWLVQNGANSGVGQNVIQLARIRGFKTVNIIRDRYTPEVIPCADEGPILMKLKRNW